MKWPERSRVKEIRVGTNLNCYKEGSLKPYFFPSLLLYHMGSTMNIIASVRTGALCSLELYTLSKMTFSITNIDFLHNHKLSSLMLWSNLCSNLDFEIKVSTCGIKTYFSILQKILWNIEDAECKGF